MAVGEMDLVIKRGQVVTGSGVKKLAIGIKDGRIAALTSGTESLAARQTIDADGKYVLPGIVDPENHLGTHRPLKDGLHSETRAAAAGGVTTWGEPGTSTASARITSTGACHGNRWTKETCGKPAAAFRHAWNLTCRSC